ncbi:ABC transporter substrate-binding protein [Streptomyces sp. CB01881]|uniref:ABC transporter substrate-binding protein n=1 Tax=Streptomyces sp. CB01881 TaxID=2078691 RepID=UPI000CDBC81D|nr:ABC transporter substrate-binding protein [Streptomyces sp. CB01881]AUY52644.1 ABC transporter substrate-binding protein [Streptomyces sp. CB01881]TYC70362.1 ABC transporter substrate-binding protein [Streptomyces sp. CB01881]
MSRRTLPVPLAAAVTATAVALAGCGGTARSSTSTPLVDHGTVRIAASSETPSFDPYSAFGAAQARYAYDSLLNVAPDGTVVSGLASSWQATTTTAVFTLRPGITCSDGTPLTASAVARALTYAGDPANQLAGARTVLPGVPFTASADDRAGTVSATAAAPFPFLTRTLGLLPVVCPAGLDRPEALDRATQGTGPYVLTRYTPGGPYEFTVREGYTWGPAGAGTAEPGLPARIVLSVVPQASTAANLLLTGGVEIASVNGPDRARLTGRGLTSADVATVVGLTFFNQRPGRPLADPALRRALVSALDRQGLANVAVGGTGRPATDFGAEGAVCHADLASAHLPAQNAAAALRTAGWSRTADGPLGKDGHPLRLRLITSPDIGPTLPSAAELMARAWTALGADVRLVTESLPALVNAMYRTGDFDVVVGSTPGFALPVGFVPFFSGPTPAQGLNFAGVANPEYDALVARALQETDTAGCGTWNQASAALLRSADALPIADGRSTVYGHRTTFATTFGGQIVPTSIRLHR